MNNLGKKSLWTELMDKLYSVPLELESRTINFDSPILRLPRFCVHGTWIRRFRRTKGKQSELILGYVVFDIQILEYRIGSFKTQFQIILINFTCLGKWYVVSMTNNMENLIRIFTLE